MEFLWEIIFEQIHSQKKISNILPKRRKILNIMKIIDHNYDDKWAKWKMFRINLWEQKNLVVMIFTFKHYKNLKKKMKIIEKSLENSKISEREKLLEINENLYIILLLTALLTFPNRK